MKTGCSLILRRVGWMVLVFGFLGVMGLILGKFDMGLFEGTMVFIIAGVALIWIGSIKPSSKPGESGKDPLESAIAARRTTQTTKSTSSQVTSDTDGEAVVGKEITMEPVNFPLQSGEQVLCITRWKARSFIGAIAIFAMAMLQPIFFGAAVLLIQIYVGWMGEGKWMLLLSVVVFLYTLVEMINYLICRSIGRAVLTNRRIVVKDIPRLRRYFEIPLEEIRELDIGPRNIFLGQGLNPLVVKIYSGSQKKLGIPDAQSIMSAYYRFVRTGRQSGSGVDPIESAIAARRAAEPTKSIPVQASAEAGRETTAGFCPNCGTPLLSSDSFCTSCGTPGRERILEQPVHNPEPATEKPGPQKCPMCAEQIPADAAICPYCGTPLVAETLPPPPPVKLPPTMPVHPLRPQKKKGSALKFGVLVLCLSVILTILAIIFISLAANGGLQLPVSIVSPTRTPTRIFTPTRTLDYTATQRVLENQRMTATAYAAQTVVFDASHWTQAIFDPFDSNQYKWPMGSSEDGCMARNTKLSNGRYVWSATAKGGCVWSSSPKYQVVEDFYLAVDCQQISGAEDAACGVILRHLDDDYYYFSISTDQDVRMYLLLESEWTSLLNQKNQAIQPWKANRITVIARGSHFLFLVNDQYVAELDDQNIASGKVGLMFYLNHADDVAVFELDNFELRVP